MSKINTQSFEMLEVMWYVCYTEIIGNNITNKNFLWITHKFVSNVLLCHSSTNTLFSIGEASMNYVSVKTKPTTTVGKTQTGKHDLS
jgi:hypothetical protein